MRDRCPLLFRLATVLLAALLLGNCSQKASPTAAAEETPPDFPALNLDGMDAALRAALDKPLQAARAAPSDAEAVGHVGKVLHAYGEREPAEGFYAKAASLAPAKFAWQYYLGKIRVELGNADGAIDALQEAVVLNATYVAARIDLANLLVTRGQAELAKQLCRETLAKNPALANAAYVLGLAYAATGDLNDAALQLQKACRLFPEYGEAHAALANVNRRLGNEQQARLHASFAQVAALRHPPLADALMEQVWSLRGAAADHLQVALSMEAAGNDTGAVAEVERALALQPEVADAHARLVALYAKTGQADNVERHYREAVRLNSQAADLHYNYGVVLQGGGRLNEAQAAYRKALTINPFLPDAHHNLGVLRDQQQDQAQAASEYRAALEADPQHALANFHLGRLLLNQEKFQEAVPYLERSLEPENPETCARMYALSVAYSGMRETAQARRWLEEARKLAMTHDRSDLLAAFDEELQRLQ